MTSATVKMPDLYADIVPGKSAAGFDLGSHIRDFSDVVACATPWRSEFVTIDEGVLQTPGWFYYSGVLKAKRIFGHDYYYGYGAVKLRFTPEGVLDWIQLAEGYQGKVFGSIKVGDKLIDVYKYIDLIFDDVEELHCPSDSENLPGLMFAAENDPIAAAPDQRIWRIFVIRP